jgi:AraC-like DNA-binding protein
LTARPRFLLERRRQEDRLSGSPAEVAATPRLRWKQVDVLSEVLKTVHLRGALFFNACFSAPWNISSPSSACVAPVLAPGAEHLIIYHLLTEGRAYAKTDDGDQVTVNSGEIVIFPHGDQHTLRNGARCKALDASKALPEILAQNLKEMSFGGGGEVTKFICGYMACDRITSQPLLKCLPPVLKIGIRDDAAGEWLEATIRFTVQQALTANTGSAIILAKLSEVLFLEAIRRYVATLPQEQTGWLAGARDPVVGHCLSLLHTQSSHHWTIAELAKQVALSRSALAERFTFYLGEPPIAYLTRWRLQLAARTLESTSRSVLQIASEVGYESEAAFNRAFKRLYGAPPAQYRRAKKVPEIAELGRAA